MKKAPLIAQIPPDRFRPIDGSVPQVGDIVLLDQAFTFPDGEPGCLVYGLRVDGKFRWEAEVYESEIGSELPSRERESALLLRDPESEACAGPLAVRIREELTARIAIGDDPYTDEGQRVLSELIADAILDAFSVRNRSGTRYG